MTCSEFDRLMRAWVMCGGCECGGLGAKLLGEPGRSDEDS